MYNDNMYDAQADGLNRLLDQTLLDSELAWWEWDIDSNSVMSNDRRLTMLGYAPEDFEGAGYQAYTALVHPLDHGRAMQAMRDCLEGRTRIYQVDYRIMKADGAYTWYMDRGMVIARSSEGTPTQLRGIVLDLGEAFGVSPEHDLSKIESSREALPIDVGSSGLVALCSVCRRFKISEEEWISIDSGALRAFPSAVSHGLCPQCINELYPSLTAN